MSDALVRVRAQPGSAVSGGAYANGEPPAPGQHPLDRPLAVLLRYKWLLVVFLIAGAAAGFVGTRFITPEYDVRATVWLASETRDASGGRGPIRSNELLNSTAWIELFRSFRIVDEVVRQLALYLHVKVRTDAPVFAGFQLADRFLPGTYELSVDKAKQKWALRTSAGLLVGTGSPADSVGSQIGFRWLLPPTVFDQGDRKVEFTVATPRETSIELLSRLEAKLANGSNFLWLTYHDPDPQLAAKTLNLWLTEYVSVAEQLKKRNVSEFANILEGQLRYAERATQNAEQAYQAFRVNTITLPTEGGPVAAGIEATRDPALQSYFDQKIQYDNLRHDREALEKNVANAASGSTPYEALLLIPSVAQSPGAEALREAFRNLYQTQEKLRSERQHFTDEHPAVKDLISTVDALQNRTIPNLAGQLLAQLKERELDYQRRIQGASRELQQIPPRTIEEMRLKRAVTVAEGLYTNLKGRYAEARLAEASATPDLSVLDTAIAPLSPSKNTAPRVVLMGIAGGVAAGLALAFLMDRLDRKIRYAEQATSELGLVIAGAVPRIPKRGIAAGSPEQVTQFVESFRTLRMHVSHSVPGERLALAVTSAAPGDGKSLVSANLALSFAEAGLRTVLVDGDTRRGALHKIFDQRISGGLTEYLAGIVEGGEIVRSTKYDNLSFVSCGKRHARSPELLATQRLTSLLQDLTRSFEIVIVDTPPLAAGIDGYALSAATGQVLLVLRMGETEKRLVSAKLAVLDRLPVTVVGAVLNGVQLTGEFQYYAYSSGYSVDRSDGQNELVAGASR